MREKRIHVKLMENLKFLGMLKNPSVFLADWLKLTKKETVIYSLRSGIDYKIRPQTCDQGVIKEIIQYHCYDPKDFTVGENDIVFDIGAQIGIFSVYAAFQAKNGKVYSFEPLPDNFSLLKENAELNKCANIVLYNAALTETGGKRNLFLAGNNTGGHSLVQLRAKNDQTVEINSFSLPEVMAREKIERIDFFKIDCEGGEYEIFFNLPLEILKKIKKISMEYHNLDEKRNGEKMKEFLVANGFQVTLTSGKFPMIYAKQ
jgi:FkbM family methyltransferase